MKEFFKNNWPAILACALGNIIGSFIFLLYLLIFGG